MERVTRGVQIEPSFLVISQSGNAAIFFRLFYICYIITFLTDTQIVLLSRLAIAISLRAFKMYICINFGGTPANIQQIFIYT